VRKSLNMLNEVLRRQTLPPSLSQVNEVVHLVLQRSDFMEREIVGGGRRLEYLREALRELVAVKSMLSNVTWPSDWPAIEVRLEQAWRRISFAMGQDR
jgi:hypothetical protein